VVSLKSMVIEMPHEIINHDDGSMTYREIDIVIHNDRYTVVSNIDLLDLGLCTPKTLSRGHRGYSSLATLMKRIDRGLGD